MSILRLGVLSELKFPEYRGRHIFTAKLRLAIFIGFWLLYLLYLKDWMEETTGITITISIAFAVTTICYYNIFANRLVLPSIIMEIFADLVAMTSIVYLTGGPESEYFTIYIFYSLAAGMFYNFQLAILTSVLSIICYTAFILLCYAGVIPPLLIAMDGMVPVAVRSPYFHPFLLAALLFLGVYATKISHYFTQLRERMLENRNKELLALQKMSSTIRVATELPQVIDRVLQAVLEGLNLKVGLLMLFDRYERRVRCFAPQDNPTVSRVEELVGFKLSSLYLTLEALDRNPAFRSLKQNKIIFRRDLAELTADLKPSISPDQSRAVQEYIGVQKMIGVPLVAEEEVIGALIGFTQEPFVEEKLVKTLEAFADQAALAIETATLIEELKKKNVELQEANRVKSEFLATMSHELRTPLTAIIGFSELLLEGVMGEMNEEQKESLREVLNNGSNLLEMINNLLDLAKVESGKMELTRVEFDLADLVDRLRRLVAPLINAKGHALHVSMAPDMPLVFGDERRVQQVMMNLLGNAIKFTPDGGRIELSARFVPAPDDIFSVPQMYAERVLAMKSGFFTVSVSDNGIGVPTEKREVIFDMFQQADSSVTRNYEGSGLGLALAREFVELHGGCIWVESEEGKGAAFTFIIPRSPKSV